MEANLRKTPRQARSRDTVDVILEAAARIIAAGGSASFNTNAVAEIAGISIGSLYEYFPGKEAILVEFARREIRAHQSAIIGVLALISQDNNADFGERLVESLLSISDRRIPARRAARQVLISMNLGHEISESLDAICEYVMENSVVLYAKGANVPDAHSLYVATRAVSGVITGAIDEGLDLTTSLEVKRELAALINQLFGFPRRPI